VYDHSYHPLSLLLAKVLFLQGDVAALLSDCPSHAWWAMRYARVHQDVLEQNSATLKAHVDVVIPRAMAQYSTSAAAKPAAPSDTGADAASSSAAAAAAPTAGEAAAAVPQQSSLRHRLSSHLQLEACHIYHCYWQYAQIDACLSSASRLLGVDVQLTGMMGKRTRWQKEEKAQLCVRVIPDGKNREGKQAAAAAAASTTEAPVDPLLVELLPFSLSLGSDVLLDKVSLSAPGSQADLDSELSVAEQALLLARFEHANRTTSGHITRDEEMMAYITRVLQESSSGRKSNRSWAVECSALYHRSVLECRDKHAQDRALQQLEELSALFDRLHAPTTVASVAELSGSKELADYRREDVLRVRMRDVYLSNYPSIWTLKQGIAATFQAIGLYKSALDIFESIHLYDGIIESCMLLGKLTQAEELIRARLAEKPREPKFLCLLADCTRDTSLYEQAWEASGRSYPRAQRSLANFKMGRGLHREALPHFQLALDLNPVFPAEWYAMGFCALECREWGVASVAFSRTVSFDPEYGNAWNNLAAAHLHLKQKPQAFSALEQAVKFKNESWKLWENYLVTAVDLHEYGKAIAAMEHVVTLKANLNTAGEKEARLEREEKTGEAGKKVLDEEVLTILHRVVMDVARGKRRSEGDGEDDGQQQGPQAFLVTRFLQLLNKIADVLAAHPLVYSYLADVLWIRGEHDKSILMREKEVRFMQSAGWLDDLHKTQDVVRAHEQLVDGYLRNNQRGQLQAAKFTLDALLAKMKKAPSVADKPEGQACIKQVEGFLEQVAAALPNAKSNQTAAAAAAAGAGGSSSSLSIWR